MDRNGLFALCVGACPPLSRGQAFRKTGIRFSGTCARPRARGGGTRRVMRVLVATDAWHPQVNGVVRTLTSLERSAAGLGVSIDFLTPEGFPSLPAPSYPGLRLALPSPLGIARRIVAAGADAIHIATEGPIGHMVRRYCVNRGLPFTTSYTTRFPEYVSARLRIPQSWSYAVLRRFHAAATVTMVSTPSLMAEFTARGFANLGMWTRGVDSELFSPARAIDLDLPRPIFISVGRIAREKNLEAFLCLDLPGTKIVIGQGPDATALQRRFPQAKFLGLLDDALLAAHLAAADVFVFPSRTDTFGLMDEDLRAACRAALRLSRAACREFALAPPWEQSARQFIGHMDRVRLGDSRKSRAGENVALQQQVEAG